MLRIDRDDDLLPEQRDQVQSRVRLLPRNAIDREFQRAFEQAFVELPRIGVPELQLDAGMMALDRSDQIDDLIGRDGAQRRLASCDSS